jgi:hypothetical protein
MVSEYMHSEVRFDCVKDVASPFYSKNQPIANPCRKFFPSIIFSQYLRKGRLGVIDVRITLPLSRYVGKGRSAYRQRACTIMVSFRQPSFEKPNLSLMRFIRSFGVVLGDIGGRCCISNK